MQSQNPQRQPSASRRLIPAPSKASPSPSQGNQEIPANVASTTPTNLAGYRPSPSPGVGDKAGGGGGGSGGGTNYPTSALPPNMTRPALPRTFLPGQTGVGGNWPPMMGYSRPYNPFAAHLTNRSFTPSTSSPSQPTTNGMDATSIAAPTPAVPSTFPEGHVIIPEQTGMMFRRVQDAGEAKMLWFAAPPVDVMAPGEEPVHSLEYLAYRQSKEKGKASSEKAEEEDVEMVDVSAPSSPGPGTNSVSTLAPTPSQPLHPSTIPDTALQAITDSIQDLSRQLIQDIWDISSQKV